MAEYINRERARFEAKRYFKNMDEIQEDLDMLFCMLPAENVAPVQEWISVKDRLPDNKEHDWVLAQVVEDNGYMHIPKVMEYRQLRNDWFEETYGWLSEHNGLFSVTHWMPLPNPPEMGKMEE